MRPLIAGNWKMHGLYADLHEIESIAALAARTQPHVDILICQTASKTDPRSASKIGSDSLLMKLRRRFGLVSKRNQRHAVSSRLRVAPARLFRG